MLTESEEWEVHYLAENGVSKVVIKKILRANSKEEAFVEAMNTVERLNKNPQIEGGAYEILKVQHVETFCPLF